MVIRKGLRDSFPELLGNVVLLWPLIRITDRQVVLRAVPRAVCALASGLSTAEVTLDQRAPQDLWVDGSRAGEQRGPSSAEEGGGFPSQGHRYSQETVPSLLDPYASVNPFD